MTNIIDTASEMLFFAFIAAMAGIPWALGFAQLLGINIGV